MTIRFKLFLSSVIVILMTVLIFSAVAYTSARNYTQHNGQTLIHKENLRLIRQLNQHTPILEQIQQIFPVTTDSDHLYIVVNTQTNDIASEWAGTGLITRQRKIIQKIQPEKNTRGGIVALNGEEYLWANDSIPNTYYELINVYRDTENNAQGFLEFIGIPLSITVFIGIWIAFWGATIIANLFKKIEDANSQLVFQARHDSLTQLPNRDALTEIFQKEISSAKQNNQNIYFCLIDIDALKDINDTLGQEHGDTLLSQITQRLKQFLHSADHIGRFGGNKFAVILHRTQTSNIETISSKVLENFDRLFEINNQSLFVRARLGISIFPEHADNSLSLIQKAETALHKARKMALDFAVYDISLDKNNADRLRLTHDLRNAIHNEELKLYYQPQLDVKSGTIKSVEALARWIHPEQGFIPPDIFIELAEQSGLIQPLTDWVLRAAIEQCASWEKMGTHITVSVNLSARNLHDEALGNQVSNLLNYWGIKPDQLCLEITETSMMTDPQHARKLLDALDNLGVRISIDDFGTGYSSLAYLKQLPVDELKIDKSFVLNMATDESDASIVRATVSLAHDLGLEVVAEGVEDQASQDVLENLGCEIIQGYHFARPMPPADVTPMLLDKKFVNNNHQPKK